VRVLLVNSMRAFGGGERWALEAASGLAARGHEVALAVRRGSELGARAGRMGLPCRAFAMRGDVDPGSIVGLARWARSLRPDVLSVNIERAVRLGCAAARLAGVRGVVERRGLLLPIEPSVVDRLVYARCVTHLIANCEAIRESVVLAGLVPRERTSVIPNGIDPARVSPGGGDAIRAEFGIGPEDPLIAIVGRLAPDKRHADAVAAFAEIVAERPAARLIVVGSGGLSNRLRDLAGRLTPPGSVIFAGERDDVSAILDASNVLAVASVREGMPHTILEAMVAGVPVAATAVAGIPEMIRDGSEGLLVPPEAPGEMARALRRLLDDRDLAGRLASAAWQRVHAEFGLEAMIDGIEECFAAVAAGGVSA
jgi:glycosyltransferase involved in cell wall biosynthesis